MSSESSRAATLAQAIEYRRRGWSPIPVPIGSKNPGRSEWQLERLSEDEIRSHFSNGCNIGLLLGAPSGGLVDVDLDCDEAIAAAERILPPTGMMHGRASRPRSHHFYLVTGSVRTTRFRDVGDSRAVLCELRADGCQTIVPPSVHPSGESIVGEGDGVPASISSGQLVHAVGKVAAAALLARHWPDPGVRHDFSLAIAGFLLRRGMAASECSELVRTAAAISGDDEVDDRERAVTDTASALERDARATGFPTLAKIVGEATAHELLHRLTDWLGLAEGAEEDGPDFRVPTVKCAALFPLLVLPPSLQRYVEEASAAFDCPPDYFAVPMLTAAGAAIGCSRVVEVKSGWQEGPRIYTAIVGPPGVTKSPALRTVMRPLAQKQAASVKEWEERRCEHQKQLLFYEKELRDWKKTDDAGEPPVPPAAPTPERILTSDATVEAMAVLLQENPRGVLLYRDEVVGWVLSLNQYRHGKGADRQFFLSAWSGETITVDRRSNSGPVVVQSPFLSVLGGMTPDMLGQLCDKHGREDGFMHRIVFAFPDSAPTGLWTEAAISPISAAAWEHALVRLWELRPTQDENDHPEPVIMRLTPEAKAAWVSLYEEVSRELVAFDARDERRGIWAKLRSYCLRFALIIQLLRWATNDGSMECVDERSVVAAAALVKYFQKHTTRVYGQLRSTADDRRVELAVAWIQRRGGKARVRELVRYRVGGVKKKSQADQLVDELIDRGLATQVSRVSKKGGRPSEWVILKAPKVDSRQNPPGNPKRWGDGNL